MNKLQDKLISRKKDKIDYNHVIKLDKNTGYFDKQKVDKNYIQNVSKNNTKIVGSIATKYVPMDKKSKLGCP